MEKDNNGGNKYEKFIDAVQQGKYTTDGTKYSMTCINLNTEFVEDVISFTNNSQDEVILYGIS